MITTSLRVSGVYSGRIRKWDWHFSPQTSHEYRSRREKGHILGAVFSSGYSSVGKESACNAGDPDLIPGLGRSPGEGTGYPLQYSWASLVDSTGNVHGVAKSQM